MPTTVSGLFTNAGLVFGGPVRWSHPLRNGTPGVYVVSTSSDPEKHLGLCATAPISIDIVSEWIRRVPAIELDEVGDPASADIANRLAEFWLPDENILYIGMTSQPLQTRVYQYYSTPLGDPKPHRGGHWLKTLSNLTDLFIYHAACDFPNEKEDKLIGYFISNVSAASKSRLKDPQHPFPFANLEFPKGTRKKHGIGKSTL